MKEHRNPKFLNFIEILCRIGHKLTNNQVYKTCQDEISEKAQKSLIKRAKISFSELSRFFLDKIKKVY